MRILFIGGTGTISMAITRLLAQQGHELYLLNRGSRNADLPENVRTIIADISYEQETAEKLAGMDFDCVGEFIGFVPQQLERDFRLFGGRTKQFIYISSASAYQKPPTSYIITEETPLENPYWEYSRNKKACEEYLMERFREDGFPVTIVRPSHTYDERSVPLGVHGRNGSWQVVKRIMEGKPVIIHGDGSSLWTITHNSDFAKAYVGLIGDPRAIGEAFHITSDESVSWNEIYHAIADALGVELKPYYVSSQTLADMSDYDFVGSLIGDKANSVHFDNSKVRAIVPDFKAEITAKEGIRRTVENILAHPEYQHPDEEFDSWCDRVIAALEKAKKDFH
ncbi:Nucleoside-diphosphate-sugar epimerase [Ruminococcus sp. YE71]|uniref:SDR family oxidoreductase n=1 Tax=unclassified Ruminococcus TaxID=2608920 RepID=UPI0008873230|nr:MULTISPECIES: SDR family oxidoreductase [unclassified Ruminococcus]SDA20602.1 Nucleoside-diphosphate-sugar epimerase [Ruminococcus sp. YE78]SFW33965.1 Nucleoside-diphosphate-sugar epimerase [Ruminococcus sp. YE71]